MFIVLALSAAFAAPYGPVYDEVLVDHPATFRLPEEVAAAVPAWEVSPLQGDGVIDLVEAPPLMPARPGATVEPMVRAASSVAAVTVEARTRE